MSNENVKCNEIQCNKIILGNEETGHIELSVSKEEESTALILSQGSDLGKIVMSFKSGKPSLSIFSTGGDKEGAIEIGFTDAGIPLLNLIGERVEDKDPNAVTVGFDSDGTPMLSSLPEVKKKEGL